MIRDDLSNKLIHLTKGDDLSAEAALLSILEQRKLIGGTGAIEGGYKCVCFSESPISKLGTLFASEMALKVRYRPYGVMVDKEWLYQQGGRPVIYQPHCEFELLDERQKFRHVRYEPENDIDFTWEREWRIHTDCLDLDPELTTVIVPRREGVRKILEPHEKAIWRRAALPNLPGIPSALIRAPWHFISLEDLGVPLPAPSSA